MVRFFLILQSDNQFFHRALKIKSLEGADRRNLFFFKWGLRKILNLSQRKSKIIFFKKSRFLPFFLPHFSIKKIIFNQKNEFVAKGYVFQPIWKLPTKNIFEISDSTSGKLVKVLGKSYFSKNRVFQEFLHKKNYF